MNINFTGKIIDMHTHAGNWQGRHYSVSDVTKLGSNLKNDEIDTFIMSNIDCFEKENGKPRKNELLGNRELINEVKSQNNIKVLLVGDPENGNVKNLEQLYKESPKEIVGLKFHPKVSGLISDSQLYDPYLEFADKNNLPCLFHSQISDINNPQADPSDPRIIYQLAKRHPNVPVILGHTGAGGAESHQIAINTIIDSINNNDAKLYADISWMDWENGLPSDNKPSVINLIKKLNEKGRTDRILFGTDAPLGCFGEKNEQGLSSEAAYQKSIDSLKTAIKDNFPDNWEKLTDDILYNNSKKIFFDNGKKKTVKNNSSKNKVILGIGTIITLGTTAFIGAKIKAKGNQKTTK